MKKFINFMGDFLIKVHSKGESESAKRFYGGLCIVFGIIGKFAACDNPEASKCFDVLLYIGAGLLGLGVFEKLKSV